MDHLGRLTNKISVPVVPSVPGIFTLDASGSGQAAVLNQDWTVNRPPQPAPRGSVVMVFLTGAGQTTPPGDEGAINTDPWPVPTLPVEAMIGPLTTGTLAPFPSRRQSRYPGLSNGRNAMAQRTSRMDRAR